MRTITIVLFLYIVKTAAAQEPVPAAPFIKLKEGTIISGSSLSAEKNIFGNIKDLTLDGHHYRSSDVMYFKGNSGGLYGLVSAHLRESCFEGKFNLFVIYGGYTQSYSPGYGGYGGYGYGMGRYQYSKSRNRYYYSSGLGFVKKVNVSNLLMDVTDNAEAFTYITQAKRMRNAVWASYGIAFGTLGYTYYGLSSNSLRLNQGGVYAVTGIFLGGILSGVICNSIKWRRVQQSVKAYCGYDIIW